MSKQIYINGNIITMNEAAPSAEALGLAGETIAVIGSNEEVMAWAGDDAEVVDVGGKTMIPGLIESHNHISIGACNHFKNNSCVVIKGLNQTQV